jgi:hypothetical protein
MQLNGLRGGAWRYLCMVALLLGLMFGPARAQQVPNPGQSGFLSVIQGFSSTYTFTQGNYAAFGAIDPTYPCQPYITAFSSCFGNNPSTPYLLVQPPVETMNYLPSYVQSTFQSGGTSQFYQLGASEAIVTIITLPPTSAYFSLQTYMLERSSSYYGITGLGTSCTGGTLVLDPVTGDKHTEAPDCNFVDFAYFANAVNNATQSTPVCRSGTPGAPRSAARRAPRLHSPPSP